MAMVCTHCNTSHEQRLQCPTCGARLVFREQRIRSRGGLPTSRHWMQTLSGRVLIGLLLAQGVCFGLHHLITAGLLIFLGDEPTAAFWQSRDGLIVMEFLRLLPLIVGGVLAGAGQNRAFQIGIVIGLLNSVIYLLTSALLTHQQSHLSWYGQPIVQALFATVGTWIGSTIWKPLSIATLTSGQPRNQRNLVANRPRRPLLAGPIYWVRVAFGLLLTVAGSLWADYLFQKMLESSNGVLDTASRMEDRLFAWEIRGLATLFGGALAGATTINGLKQGLLVGVGSTFVLLLFPAHHTNLGSASLTILITFPLAMGGGWFGSQLLPPIVIRRNVASQPKAFS